MSPNSSGSEKLLGSVRRSLLGGLIGIIALVFIGVAMRTLSSGNYLVGGVSGILAIGAIVWIGYLFVTGYREAA